MMHIISRKEHIFENRVEAASFLGKELSNKFRLEENSVVLGVPRGGIVIAQVVAKVLNLPFDIILSGKLSSPDEPEFAIGAITEDGSFTIDQNIVEWMNISSRYLDEEKKRKLQMLENRKKMYRSIMDKIPLSGKTVIITDDGIATGASLRAAITNIMREDPQTIIAAIPVGTLSGVQKIGEVADSVFCLFAPPSFRAVGEYYRNFDQVGDDEVLEILEKADKSNLKIAGIIR
jgi:putative phosphoribosyl transferase